MKKIFALLTFVLFSTSLFAYDFEVDGIYYNILVGGESVAVTYRCNPYDNNYQGEYAGSIIIPETVSYGGNTYKVTTIGYLAFGWCQDLISVTLPNSISAINENAFEYCRGLATITLGKSVITIDAYAFRECSSLTDIILPNSVTWIGEDAFAGCTSLHSITLPNSITKISNYMFYRTNLTSVTIPNSVTTIGEGAFRDSGLTSITIPNSVTWIDYGTFWECRSLTSITLPNSITKISSCMFYQSGLTSITIPNGVTTIGSSAFHLCMNLQTITIPSTVILIEDYAFHACTSLTSITCEAVTPPTIAGELTFLRIDTTIPLYVPEESIEAYKVADGWKEFTNILPLSSTPNTPTTIEDTELLDTEKTTCKVLENGTIYILRNSEKYTMDGQRVN